MSYSSSFDDDDRYDDDASVENNSVPSFKNSDEYDDYVEDKIIDRPGEDLYNFYSAPPVQLTIPVHISIEAPVYSSLPPSSYSCEDSALPPSDYSADHKTDDDTESCPRSSHDSCDDYSRKITSRDHASFEENEPTSAINDHDNLETIVTDKNRGELPSPPQHTKTEDNNEPVTIPSICQNIVVITPESPDKYNRDDVIISNFNEDYLLAASSTPLLRPCSISCTRRQNIRRSCTRPRNISRPCSCS